MTIRFPGETEAYRAAREDLLRAEIELRRQTEAVAALRRALPLGGAMAEDYVFDEAANGSDDLDAAQQVRFSGLFRPGMDTLAVYSFMFGPEMKQACPSCTSILDSLDGSVPHVLQRANLAVVAKSPLRRIREFARGRGWRNLRLLSSARNSYNTDYHAEDAGGNQLPMLNVFVRRDDRIHHTFASELLFAPVDPGQDPRHVDTIWPLWNLLDFTPDGRGTDWGPRLKY